MKGQANWSFLLVTKTSPYICTLLSLFSHVSTPYVVAPSYLQELISFKSSAYATRSSYDKTLLHISKTKSRAGDHAFQAAAPWLWKSLPRNNREANTLERLKNMLKTHLFV